MTPHERITCPATRDSLRPLLQFVERACGSAGLDVEETMAVRVAAEEICTNVILHGYAAGEGGPITVDFTADADRVLVTIEDRCAPFDPRTIATPAVTTDWVDRPIGGMGLHLVRSLMDDVRHELIDEGGNRVTLVKRRVAAPIRPGGRSQ